MDVSLISMPFNISVRFHQYANMKIKETKQNYFNTFEKSMPGCFRPNFVNIHQDFHKNNLLFQLLAMAAPKRGKTRLCEQI